MKPSPNLSEALTEPGLHEKLLPYARFRSRLLYPDHGDHYAKDLIQYAYERTWAGDRPWSPEAGPLLGHLRLIIRSKSRDDRKRARRGLPGGVDADERFVPTWADDGIDAERERVQSVDLQHRNEEAFAELRRLADGDDDVLLILSAYEQQVFVRKSVIEVTSLTAPRYKAALARLQRLVNELPARLHPNCGARHLRRGA